MVKQKVVVRNFRTTTQYGALEGKTQSNEVKYYNLNVIISVGHYSPKDKSRHSLVAQSPTLL
ncbi:hypothetical protein DW262_13280 [Segatella copri]|uniref:Uncharacterized protein n=1 Tax=Segatella copri TaxID=165179 RepID=A0A3R6DRQ0_9BACT|nr:hypothetical protein DW263_13855 [Segatella copri]RHG32608.1 hypothetical protein DW262_13280 [Segatella copri]RHG63238.1 hypothetical protein DW250_13450 [Segatella copri]